MDRESLLRLTADLLAVRAFLAETGGSVQHREQDPDGLYWVTLKPRSDEPAFIARVIWRIYPEAPPSVRFATDVGGEPHPAARPLATGYREADVCKPFTAEGQALHPEWRSGVHAWRGDGNAFLYVVEIMQADIDRVEGRRPAA